MIEGATPPMRYAEVAVTLPVEGRFHYLIPEHLIDALEVGHRVVVPFGKRRVTGFVIAFEETLPPAVTEDKVRPITERLDVEPLIPKELLQLATFAADYYLASVGEVLKLALPPGMTAASTARYAITAAGRHWLESGRDRLPTGRRIGNAARRLLEGAVKASGVKATAAAPAAALELESLGMIVKRDSIHAREAKGEIEVVEQAIGPAIAGPLLYRSPSRRAVYDLLDSGPRPVSELLGSSDRRSVALALRRLEKDGLILRRRRVAQSGDASPSVISRGGPGLAENAPDPNLESPPPLMRDQALALEQILASLDANTGGAFLLHGVTASGKTEVYLRAIAHARARGQGAIVLVPEIALTPQLEARFRARFGDQVAVLHSALTDGERRRRWQRLRQGQAMIALGPRSAVWAPVRALGVIVVDEEHDASFKQGSDVRYNGRDLAWVRARSAGAAIIFGSATPSLESQHAVRQHRLTELRLRERVHGRPMPTIETVDLNEERRAAHGEVRVLSRALGDRLRATVEQKGQAILFLNRRGFNTIVYCEDCGTPRKCPHCDVSMTFHKASTVLACHHCGHVERLETRCRSCKSIAVRPFGFGTERVVEAVKEVAPDARVVRLDRDVTQHAGELDRTLDLFKSGAADVMVGTQMVAKGHDFPGVTLVGIVLADASLAFPDFRAAERTFQLLTQVAGRAGRADAPGHVVIQTLEPAHYALDCARRHEVDRFFEIESASRKSAGYPPYTRIGLIRIESKDEALLGTVAAQIRRSVQAHASGAGVRWRGPVTAPIARVRDKHRRMMMVVAPSPAGLNAILRRVRADASGVNRRVDVIFDVDPVDLL